MALYADFTGSPDVHKVVVLQISGLTVSKGTAVTLDASETAPVNIQNSMTPNGATEAVVAYSLKPSPGGPHLKAVVLSISGTTITVETPITLQSSAGVGSTVSISTLETDKYILLLQRKSSAATFASVVTQSGTTLTDNTRLTLEAADGGVANSSCECVALSTTSAIAVYPLSGGGIRASLLNISGTTVTEDDNFDFEAGATISASPQFVDRWVAKLSSTKVAAAYAVSGVAKLIILENTGAAISAGTVFTPAPDDNHHLASGIDSNSFIVVSASTDQEIETFNVSGTTITAAGDNVATPNTPVWALPTYLGGSKWIAIGAKSSSVEAFAFSSSDDAYAYRYSSGGLPGAII
jgi:hypothetical protein